MPNPMLITQLDTISAVNAVSATLRKIDPRLMDHGERVACIACMLCEEGKLPLDKKTLFLLSVFHDVGAYKTEEIDRMLEFETSDVQDHSIYGYLFLKYMSPLQDRAEALLYHHAAWPEIQASHTPCGEYAALIHLADRFDIAAGGGPDSGALGSLQKNTAGRFHPAFSALLCRPGVTENLLQTLASGAYQVKNRALCQEFHLGTEEALDYLRMLVFAIDFRSKHTVTHSVNTISISLQLALHFGFDQVHLEKIYLGAMLHDVGKIAIPTEILEYPGRLTEAQTAVMRTHVTETEKLIRGIVPDDICEIAVRHHEKLDGSGYPHHLRGGELTFSQRIVAVADIISALSSSRSYKEPFPREKTLQILSEMSVSQLDPEICGYVAEHYDAILSATEPERRRIIDIYQNITREFAQRRQSALPAAELA